MKIRIRNILVVALIQDILVMVALVASAASFNAWLIMAGQSHHFVPAAARRSLNQSQHTLGLEFTRGPWTVQASHMEDSFGCSSNEFAAARRWQMFGGQTVAGGLMLGIAAAHRCTKPTVSFAYDSARLVTVGTSSQYIPAGSLGGGLYASCQSPSPAAHVPLCWIFKLEPTSTPITEPNPPRWVFGIAPGFYVDFGDRVRVEATLIRSPFTGHHLVFYAQVLFRLASFR